MSLMRWVWVTYARVEGLGFSATPFPRRSRNVEYDLEYDNNVTLYMAHGLQGTVT